MLCHAWPDGINSLMDFWRRSAMYQIWHNQTYNTDRMSCSKKNCGKQVCQVSTYLIIFMQCMLESYVPGSKLL